MPRVQRRIQKKKKSRSCKIEFVRNCMRDGGRPSEIALQGEVSNHSKLRWAKSKVVSVREKVSCETSDMG